jgi:hypothetical protein
MVNMVWVIGGVCLLQGNYSGLLVQLSAIHSELRGDASGVKNEDSAQVTMLRRSNVTSDDGSGRQAMIWG